MFVQEFQECSGTPQYSGNIQAGFLMPTLGYGAEVWRAVMITLLI
jgi:hypothetical protein